MSPDLQFITRAFETYRQPTIAYHRGGIRSELDLVTSHLRSAVRDRLPVVVLFSVKANANPELLQWLAEQGAGAEVSSMPEFELAQRAGFRVISATSPGLSAEHISTLCTRGALVNIDNPAQLAGVPDGTEIGLRLCLPLDLTSDKSENSRFGVMLDDPALREALRRRNCKVTRLHGHFRDIANATHLTALATRVVTAAQHCSHVVEINLGGGMTRLYKDPEAAAGAWQQCAPIFADLKPNTTLFVEPGAQLLTRHGYLGTRVVSVNERGDGRKLIVLDASKWNLVCWSEYELISPATTDEAKVADVVGPTCYEKDLWLSGVRLPAVQPGDQLIFRGLGSYVVSLARKMHALPLPHEILI